MPKLLHVLGISCRSSLTHLNRIYIYSWAHLASDKDEGKPGRTQLKTLSSTVTKSTQPPMVFWPEQCVYEAIYTQTHAHTHTYTHTPKKLSVIELEFIAETEPQSGWRISFSFRGNYWKEEWPPKLLLPATWLPACLPSMEEAFPDINHNFLHFTGRCGLNPHYCKRWAIAMKSLPSAMVTRVMKAKLSTGWADAFLMMELRLYWGIWQ